MHLDPRELDPLDYPGMPLDYPGVLRGGEFVRLAADHSALDALRGLMAGRRAVIAVGSNGAPNVLLRKLGPAAVVPIVPAEVSGLSVGHSAHRSARGYVPAAPYPAPGARASVHVSWFDRQQLTRLDATEPNYERVTVSTFPLVIAGTDERLESFDVYFSRWGVLEHASVPLPFMAQRELAVRLAELSIVLD